VVDESIFAKLFEKRLVYCDEIENGVEFGKVFKSLCNEGQITARNLHSNSFTFDLQCQSMLNCNTLPKFEAMECYSRRIAPVPTYNIYKSAELCMEGDEVKDQQLKGKILSNKAGVLKWIVDGSIAYFTPITPDFDKVKQQCVGDNDWTTMIKKTGDNNKKDLWIQQAFVN
jgi:phage/plasmid-associated DNA primase